MVHVSRHKHESNVTKPLRHSFRLIVYRNPAVSDVVKTQHPKPIFSKANLQLHSYSLV